VTAIRVLLADDEPLVRSGLRAILESEPDLTVVGEADDGAAVITQARRTRPDIVLMDVRMPRVDGIAATRQLGQLDGGGPGGRGLAEANLTDREAEVLRLIAQGRSNAEIAAELFLGVETVKTHVRNVLAKLGARDRVQAVITAYESGFIR
jgi:DNA-binding NarL/FixJ family response regulator